MIRVVIDGTAGPYTATGVFVNEDERYLCLEDRGVKVNIPVSRIIKIEDLKRVVDNKPDKEAQDSPQVQEPPAPQPTPVEPERVLHPDPLPTAVAAALGVPAQPRDVKTELLKKMGLESQQKNPQPVNTGSLSKDPVDVNVVVSGAVQKSINIQVPEYMLVANTYSPNIAKQVSLSPEIKSLMEGGVIFDGLPQVNGRNIYIKTKHLKDSVKSLTQNLGLANKISGAMGMFEKPSLNFETDFSMGGRQDDGFAIGHSPFDGQVMLDDTEVMDASPEQESTGDQGEPGPTMQNVSGEGVPKLHETEPDDRPTGGS